MGRDIDARDPSHGSGDSDASAPPLESNTGRYSPPLAVHAVGNVTMRRIHFVCTDSTNARARELAAEHPGQRLLITAEEQTAGRGRQGRFWHSPRGGAWLSIVWPTSKAPQAYAATSLVAAVAVLRAIRDVAGEGFDRARIKWPNDLLIDGRKVAGILCEQCVSPGGRGGFVIVGVGVNASFDLAALRGPLRHEPTTLVAALNRPVAVHEVVDAVERRFVEAMEEFETAGLSRSIVGALAAHLAYVGQVRSWQLPRGVVRGRVVGVDDAGRLLLEVDGRLAAFDVGEFTAEAGCPAADE